VALGSLGSLGHRPAQHLQELEHLGVGFVSLTEALDLTTPAGRAMAGLLAVFAEFEREILRERVRAGLAHARQNGKRLGRPATAALHADPLSQLTAIDADETTAEAITDWHYWLAQGYCF
jgi:DNA invertase Pin-like site-specific DNA recombinase